MPKLKDMLNEKMQIKLGQVYDDVTHPPFAVTEEEWKKQWDNKLNEAGMDKRFMQDWEKSTKALLNHMKHEYDELTRTGDHMRKKNAYKWLRGAMKDVDKVTGYAAQMAKFFGTE